jgi:tellurite resistance protein TerC
MFSQFVFVGLFFVVLMIGMLWDLGVFSKTTEVEVNAKQAIKHTAVWFSIGLLMTVAVYFFHGQLHQIATLQDLHHYAIEYRVDIDLGRGFEYAMADFSRTSSISYLSGFLLEYALSVDNLFVILLIFQSFKMNGQNQKRILIWGVIGAIVLRFFFIYLGTEMVSRFAWVMYLFGAFLIYSGFKMLTAGDEDSFDTVNHPVIRFTRRCKPRFG